MQTAAVVHRWFRRIAAVTLAAAVVGSGPAPGAQAPAAAGRTAGRAGSADPAAMARALQQRYQAVRDFSADFTQTYRGGVLRTTTQERGTVRIKKPGMMRWVYTSPERKEFVSDGRKLYSYMPADKQVIVADVPPDDQASSAVLFLAGKGDLTRDFVAAFADTAPPGAVALKLTPRTPQPEYQYLVLTADAASLRIQALATRDQQGGESTLTFANLKENQGTSDSTFVFRIPPGVDVNDGSRR